ncbi:hypothetical protein P9112_013734 [Eukaryota sp. TZLM1-RC]
MSHGIESFLEPLLSNVFDTEIDFHKNNRGDVILPGLDGSFILLDTTLRPSSRKTDGNRHGTTSRFFQVQNNGTKLGTTFRLFQIQLNATKEFRNVTTPSSPKNANVGSSSETSTVLQRYEELQSVLGELDDDEKDLLQQIMKDAEAHVEPTDYCLFEQLPTSWKQISKTGR